MWNSSNIYSESNKVYRGITNWTVKFATGSPRFNSIILIYCLNSASLKFSRRGGVRITAPPPPWPTNVISPFFKGCKLSTSKNIYCWKKNMLQCLLIHFSFFTVVRPSRRWECAWRTQDQHQHRRHARSTFCTGSGK